VNLATSPAFQSTEASLILQFLRTCQKGTEDFPGLCLRRRSHQITRESTDICTDDLRRDLCNR